MRRLFATLLALTLAGGSAVGAIRAQSASMYANPAFQMQWQQGEAITPNFWGPLTNATAGTQESYKEATGGSRLVQYFDKGRMELGANNTVTNGLLATEIFKGQIQAGDSTFQPFPAPAIAIAGDADNPGPTYAGLAAKGSLLFAKTPKQAQPVNVAKVSAAGDVSPGSAGKGAVTFSAYDEATGHNVPQSFVDYRTKAGLPTIGLAISEPFTTSVKVGGTPKDVMIQVFERRVLTYTASNPAAFQVEMGNIGQHYYQWRYSAGTGGSTPAALPAAPPAAASTPTATPSAMPGVAGGSAVPSVAPVATVNTTGKQPGVKCTFNGTNAVCK